MLGGDAAYVAYAACAARGAHAAHGAPVAQGATAALHLLSVLYKLHLVHIRLTPGPPLWTHSYAAYAAPGAYTRCTMCGAGCPPHTREMGNWPHSLARWTSDPLAPLDSILG